MRTIIKNKILIPYRLLLVVICQAAFSQAFSQDVTDLTDENTYKINNLGDAQYEETIKMTESQWQFFKRSPLMTDVSIAKRNIEYSLSTYVIEDFKRDIDEVNRIVKLSFTVKAEALYDGDGNWEVRTNYKNPQIEKLTDKEYMISLNTYEMGGLVHENIKILFPNGAKDVQQTTDEFGKTKFTYKLGGGTLIPNVME